MKKNIILVIAAIISVCVNAQVRKPAGGVKIITATPATTPNSSIPPAVMDDKQKANTRSNMPKNSGISDAQAPVRENPYVNLLSKSIQTINDDQVPAELKSRIYSPGYITHINHSDYNKTGKTLIICFGLKDTPHNPALSNKIIEDVFFNTGIGSANDFFLENSWGQFKVTNAGIVTTPDLPKTFIQYSTNDKGILQNDGDATWNPILAKVICSNAIVDWTAFDLNKDGQITPNELQIVFIIPDGLAGATRPFSIEFNTSKGHIKIRNSFVYISCKTKTDPQKGIYILSYNSNNVRHELCHGFFNTPDRYPENFVGDFDLMGNYSRTHMNIYDKMRIGWIKPKISYNNPTGSAPYGTNTESNTLFNLPAIENKPYALIRWAGLSPNEFFIIENRNIKSSPFSFDNGLPDEGIAIWWVNMSNGDIHLINASDVNQKPDTYKNQGKNALFKAGNPAGSTIFILSKQGVIAFGIKSISEVGSNMYFAFN